MSQSSVKRLKKRALGSSEAELETWLRSGRRRVRRVARRQLRARGIAVSPGRPLG